MINKPTFMKKTLIVSLSGLIVLSVFVVHAASEPVRLTLTSHRSNMNWRAGTEEEISYSTQGLQGSLLSVGLIANDGHTFVGTHGQHIPELILADSIPVNSDGRKTLKVHIPFDYETEDYRLVIQTMPDYTPVSATSSGVIHMKSSIIDPGEGDTLRIGNRYVMKWVDVGHNNGDSGAPVSISLVLLDSNGEPQSFVSLGTTTSNATIFKFDIPNIAISGRHYKLHMTSPVPVEEAWSETFTIR